MDGQIQTLVVHVDQLTPENMMQLAQSGYRVLRDPSLLIFGRNLPEANPVAVDILDTSDAPENNKVVEEPTPISSVGERNNKRHR